MSDAERRFTSVPVEIRAGKDQQHTIGGYAAKFMPAVSQNLGGFKEQIAPGAFNRSASQGWPKVMARYNHETLLGTTGGNSLRLHVDEIGLKYDVDLLDEPTSQRIYMLVQRGDVRESSFAFIADNDDWATDDTGFPLRTLENVRLLDVAPVDEAAYPDATVVDTTEAQRSLAHKFGADLAEVRKMAEHNELTKFFTRTDNTGQTADQIRSAQAALAKSLALDPDITL